MTDNSSNDFTLGNTFNEIYNNNFYYDINYLINDLNELHRKENERVLE